MPCKKCQNEAATTHHHDVRCEKCDVDWIRTQKMLINDHQSIRHDEREKEQCEVQCDGSSGMSEEVKREILQYSHSLFHTRHRRNTPWNVMKST